MIQATVNLETKALERSCFTGQEHFIDTVIPANGLATPWPSPRAFEFPWLCQ